MADLEMGDGMKVRVIANGEGRGTKVVDAESGRPFKRVRAVRFEHEAGDAPRVMVELVSVAVEVEGQAYWHVGNPFTGNIKRVRRIEFADGTEWVAEGRKDG